MQVAISLFYCDCFILFLNIKVIILTIYSKYFLYVFNFIKYVSKSQRILASEGSKMQQLVSQFQIRVGISII